MVTQQENKERIKQLNLDYNCYQPGREPLCAIVNRNAETGGFIKRSGYLNAKELSDWLDGYEDRANNYPIDLNIDEIKEILDDEDIDSIMYSRPFINFLNTDVESWASDNVKSFIKEEDL